MFRSERNFSVASEDGCADLQLLAAYRRRMERPVSPSQFSQRSPRFHFFFKTRHRKSFGTVSRYSRSRAIHERDVGAYRQGKRGLTMVKMTADILTCNLNIHVRD